MPTKSKTLAQVTKQAEEDVRRLLSGTSPQCALEEVEEANSTSRSTKFAADEDIKHCKAEIIYNANTPVLVESALQHEEGCASTLEPRPSPHSQASELTPLGT